MFASLARYRALRIGTFPFAYRGLIPTRGTRNHHFASAPFPCFSAMASPVIDNINGSASTPFLTYGTNAAGWVYTPNFSYALDGIYSTFENVGSPTQLGPVATRTVTLSVFDSTPSGALLAQTSFIADGSGGNFAPVLLLAGHNYFIGYDNVYNIGLNIPNWIPNQALGTTNLNGW